MKKEYYSEEEVSTYLKNNIRISALKLKDEILKEEQKTVWALNYNKNELLYV